jgi:hypothetical protein
MAICAGVWYYAYRRWFMPSRARIAADQMAKLAEARRALSAAISYIEYFEGELKSKSTQAERLREQVLSLQSLNAEGVKDLERKLRAMDVLNRSRLWFERLFAFMIGIGSSLAASYFWVVLRQ